jgi:hypothetical protein
LRLRALDELALKLGELKLEGLKLRVINHAAEAFS